MKATTSLWMLQNGNSIFGYSCFVDLSYLIPKTWISYDTELPDYKTVSNAGIKRIYRRINSLNPDEVVLQTDSKLTWPFYKINSVSITGGLCSITGLDCKSDNVIWNDQISYKGKWTLFCPAFEIQSAGVTSNSTTKSTIKTTTKTLTSFKTTTTTKSLIG